jgi:BlaI family penicillinase repressor
MKNPPTISDAEWDVMQVVWDAAPVTAAEVIERLARPRQWNHRTVRTLLNRLVKKRALGFKVDGKRYLYHPLISRADCVRRESRSFLSRVFGGSAGPMLVHFVNETDLSPEEIDQLKRILARKEK